MLIERTVFKSYFHNIFFYFMTFKSENVVSYDIPSIFLEGLSIQSKILRILNQKEIFPGFQVFQIFMVKNPVY